MMFELTERRKPTVDDNRDDRDDGAGDSGDTVDGSDYVIPSVVLVLVALIFLGAPGMAFYLASLSGSGEHAATALERFLLTHLGIYMAIVGVSLLLRVNSIHYLTVLVLNLVETTRHPLLIPLTAGSSLSSFLSYNTSSAGSLATLFFLSHLAVAVWGFYALLFGDQPLQLSKTTGADKRTSAFIFKNTAAASTRKREWKKSATRRGENR